MLIYDSKYTVKIKSMITADLPTCKVTNLEILAKRL